MSLDRDALYAAFEQSPGDLAGYGAMADLLDDDGWCAIGHAFRWMQRRRKWPHRRERYFDSRGRTGRAVQAMHRWAWYGLPHYGDIDQSVTAVYPHAPLKFHGLPTILLASRQRVYASHQAAVMGLAKWLTRLREVYELDEPRRGL
jgi:hypothetical protein